MDFERVAGCEVCDILQADDPNVVVETRYWRVALASDQYYLGRCYVTSLRHFGHLGELLIGEWQELQVVVRQLESACGQALGATHVTWAALMNNAYREEEPKPHVHWHVRPRYREPTTFAGEVFVDPEFGEHHQREIKRVLEPAQLDVIRWALRDAMVV